MTPSLALTYDSAAGEGVAGVGFSIGGLSTITRCPKTLARDGEIREVRDDAEDVFCFDGRRLVQVGETPSFTEYRTFPDTFVRVRGHFPAGWPAKKGLRFLPRVWSKNFVRLSPTITGDEERPSPA